MKVIGDLHIHSRFSRACSKNIDIENLEKYARIKVGWNPGYYINDFLLAILEGGMDELGR